MTEYCCEACEGKVAKWTDLYDLKCTNTKKE